ncbi:unnamed protein product [Thlaspi arvense]|uniref:DUF1985 domain-containing protein n=1 Tax=Thlaspi arvense TaxID=13288 RepID=A0AAU9R7J8_THLAR|nr:unnamed protein product [Thlaspi arvense]
MDSQRMMNPDREQGCSGSKTPPSWLFAANCYPLGSPRLNIYSKTNMISQVIGALGLQCRPFPEDLRRVGDKLKASMPPEENQKQLTLAYCILLDGVLICRDKNLTIAPEYVDMMRNMEYFLEFPRGRKSFEKTLSRFILLDRTKKCPLRNLETKTTACYGFPLALQLVFFEAVPMLLTKIPEPENLMEILSDYALHSTITLLHMNDVLEVESGPKQLDVLANIRDKEDSNVG